MRALQRPQKFSINFKVRFLSFKILGNLVKSKALQEKVETWWRWHVSLNTGYIKRQFWNRWERRMVVRPSLLVLFPFLILGTESCRSFTNPPRVQALCLCVYLGDCAYLQAFSRVHTGWFFNCSSEFSEPKWKMIGSQSEILFHEILNVQTILVGWKTFFFVALKFGRTS